MACEAPVTLAPPLGGDLDLDLHLRADQRRDRDQSGSRTDGAEDLAEDRQQALGVGDVGDVVRYPNHVSEREPRLLEHARDGGKAVVRLLLDAVPAWSWSVVVAGRACHEREVTVDDRAAVAGNRFEQVTVPDPLEIVRAPDACIEVMFVPFLRRLSA